MNLPIMPPFAPMEAQSVDEIPEGSDWQYEPKWDGFRCIAFRDGEEVYLQSKAGQPLARYFPEVVSALAEVTPRKFVLDGELAIPVRGRFSFDDLLQRIHPAESRVRKLSAEFPAVYILFDLLADSKGQDFTNVHLAERRSALADFTRRFLAGNRDIRMSPATRDVAQARHWLDSAGGNLDGIIAKRLDCPYMGGERSGMEKVKRLRTADCVVGGFRYAEGSKVIGSLLLGLYNERGELDHVGFCSGFKASERKRLAGVLVPMIEPPGFTGKAPGGLSRWSTKRSMEWQPLKTALVVEVSYDHFTGGRFRHGTRLLRWRPDKAPRQCTLDQIASARSHASLDLLEAA